MNKIKELTKSSFEITFIGKLLNILRNISKSNFEFVLFGKLAKSIGAVFSPMGPI